jgi:Putative Flp pilus-assembly TadE/G-like
LWQQYGEAEVMWQHNRPERCNERGQTIILVAISIVSLLAMAALAIDVVTLYVARTEIQRASDAAALAAAKAMSDSGITTLPTSDPAFSSGEVQALAQSMATSAIAAVLAAPNNQVSGFTVAPGSPTFNFSTSGSTPINNPHVTVTLQQTGLPTFFARIWGTRTASVGAIATAEAYNPANTSSFTPIAPKGVKPWLVANIDPATSQPFVNPTTGAIEAGVIANSDFWITADCQTGHHRCLIATNPPGLIGSPKELQYLPAVVTPNSANVCHSSCPGSGSDYGNSIQCADMNPYSCGGGSTNAQWDMTDRINPNGPPGSDTADGVECLIHALGTGLGQGQDSIALGTWPTGPIQISSGATTNLVNTSRSLVTIPIIDVSTPGAFSSTGPVTIIGFLQAFVEQVNTKYNPNDIQIKVVNVVGCSQTSNGAPTILGGNTSSPIRVRLITP